MNSLIELFQQLSNNNTFNINVSHMLKSIFLLIIAVSGNFVAETLGCKTQQLLSTNMYAKQLVTICIIYFSLSLFSNDDQYPGSNLLSATIIWFIYLLFKVPHKV